MNVTNPVYVTDRTHPSLRTTSEPGILAATIGSATLYGTQAELRRVVNVLRHMVANAEKPEAA